MPEPVRIGVVGDFNPAYPSHAATNASLAHAAAALSIAVDVRWIPTERLGGFDPPVILESHDGLWAAPASPYRSVDGMLAAIRFARERGRPFVGT
jgi:CTP synthase (UTP-ammonia lyase)